MTGGAWIEEWRAALGPDALKTTIAPSVAILLFMFSNLAQWISGWRERKRATKRVVLGVHAEIAQNLAYTRKTAEAVSAKAAIQARLAQDFAAFADGDRLTYRPLIAITDSTKFYDANLTALIDVKPKCIAPISLYYRSVADQYLAMQGINSEAFLAVSLESRLSTIDDLWQAFVDSCARGETALASLEGAYPRRWFRSIKP